MKKLRKPEQALNLPKGRLVANHIEASFSREDVYEAATLLIENDKGENLLTQADVIVQAGKLGWGLGDVYCSIGGSGQESPDSEITTLDLEKPEDALRLPQGRILVGIFEATFSQNNVLDAARILIENSDAKQLLSQAGVLERAGNKHGFGLGEGYRTI